MHVYSYLLFIMLLGTNLFFYIFFLMIRRPPISTLFPTRRSSDLTFDYLYQREPPALLVLSMHCHNGGRPLVTAVFDKIDRKSTRLNSSHPSISYAVFCLKKKKKQPQ